MNTILVIDNSPLERAELNEILKKQYALVLAENVDKAIALFPTIQGQMSAVLFRMDPQNGNLMMFLSRMREADMLTRVPVIAIEEGGEEVSDELFEAGVYDFIRKPFHPKHVQRRIAIDIQKCEEDDVLRKKWMANSSTTKLQYQLLQKQAEEVKKQAVQLKKTQREIIYALGSIVEYRNLEEGDHVRRVSHFTELMATQMMKDYPEYHLTEEDVEVMSYACMLHDIGKITIPDQIMLKPGRLDSDEFEIMKSHTTKGCEMIELLKGTWDEKYTIAAHDICRHHHERFDGKGYPDALVGDAIPISAQIVALADAYDALVSERIYKKAYRLDVAFEMIQTGECGVFSPKVLDVFRKCREFMESEIDQSGMQFEGD